jgi:hypothetical protein
MLLLVALLLAIIRQESHTLLLLVCIMHNTVSFGVLAAAC